MLASTLEYLAMHTTTPDNSHLHSGDLFQKHSVLQSSRVHKLLGNCQATLGFFSNFQLVEQLSVHRAASRFSRLDSHSHDPATSEKLKSAEYGLCREYICSTL